MNAAELYGLADEVSADLMAKVHDPKQVVMLCGMIAARVAAGPGQNQPGESGQSYSKVMNQGFASAMVLETVGQEAASNPFRLGMQS